MQENIGNLWTYHTQGHWIVITTNGTIKKDGSAVMGRGCAREAASKFPNLPAELGKALVYDGNHVQVWPQYHLITFPVKHNWFEYADLDLIKRSAIELRKVAAWLKVQRGAQPPIYCPRFGCGNGGLDWNRVREAVRNLLDDPNYIILTQG